MEKKVCPFCFFLAIYLSSHFSRMFSLSEIDLKKITFYSSFTSKTVHNEIIDTYIRQRTSQHRTPFDSLAWYRNESTKLV